MTFYPNEIFIVLNKAFGIFSEDLLHLQSVEIKTL